MLLKNSGFCIMLAIYHRSVSLPKYPFASTRTALGSLRLSNPCIPANGLNPAKPYGPPISTKARDEEEAVCQHDGRSRLSQLDCQRGSARCPSEVTSEHQSQRRKILPRWAELLISPPLSPCGSCGRSESSLAQVSPRQLTIIPVPYTARSGLRPSTPCLKRHSAT